MVTYLLSLNNSVSEYQPVEKYSRYYCLEQCFFLALHYSQLDMTKLLMLCFL